MFRHMDPIVCTLRPVKKLTGVVVVLCALVVAIPATQARQRKPRPYRPPPVKPVFAHPLAGEGVWRPSGPRYKGGPPVLLTVFRTDPAYPTVVAYAAWFDHTRTALAFYPGRY